jgi:tRNA-dihydrouridine synthase
LREVKEYVAIKRNRPDFSVLGCGDLFDEATIVRRMRESGVDGVALARGIIGNPWLFERAKAAVEGRPIPAPPTLAEQKATIAEHFSAALELYGERRTATEMRKFGVAYAKLHPKTEEVRLAFATCKRAARWFEILDEFYRD